MMQFRHLPRGSAIGTGALFFRHFGNEAPAYTYVYIDPIDPVAYPEYEEGGYTWKPAKRSDGVTGYWNGANGFVAVEGGIPHYGENLITDEVIAGAYSNAWISSTFVWATASSSASFPIAVTDGAYYKLAWDNTASATVGAVFRYGFTDRNVPSASNTLSEPRARTTPQDVAEVTVQASEDYLVIQVASGLFPDNTEHLTVREMIGYTPSNDLLMGGNPFYPPDPDEEENE